MPVNDRYPLHEVLAECRRYFVKRGRKVFIEYVMLADVNDRVEQAKELGALLDPKIFKVNLIPYNPTGMYDGSTREGDRRVQGRAPAGAGADDRATDARPRHRRRVRPARGDAMSDGYFAEDSVIRRIGNRSVLMLGGSRALLLQAAHPLVAAGIVGHSRFDAEPWARLARTMTALYTIVFGTREEADRVGAAVQRVHTRVRGALAEDVGVFPAGTPYAADDPQLMLWVHGTLVDTGLAMHEAYLGPLDAGERAAFYREMSVVARIFGVPDSVLPRTLVDFGELRRDLLARGVLSVGADARTVAAAVLRPPVPLVLRPGVRALTLAGLALLPDDVRELYGLRRNAVARAGAAPVRLLGVTRAFPRVWTGSGRGLPLRLLNALS